MNGFDFELRVQQSGLRILRFMYGSFQFAGYARTGRSHINGCCAVPDYTWPLSDGDAMRWLNDCEKAPMVFQQAGMNLTGMPWRLVDDWYSQYQ